MSQDGGNISHKIFRLDIKKKWWFQKTLKWDEFTSSIFYNSGFTCFVLSRIYQWLYMVPTYLVFSLTHSFFHEHWKERAKVLSILFFRMRHSTITKSKQQRIKMFVNLTSVQNHGIRLNYLTKMSMKEQKIAMNILIQSQKWFIILVVVEVHSKILLQHSS